MPLARTRLDSYVRPATIASIDPESGRVKDEWGKGGSETTGHMSQKGPFLRHQPRPHTSCTTIAAGEYGPSAPSRRHFRRRPGRVVAWELSTKWRAALGSGPTSRRPSPLLPSGDISGCSAFFLYRARTVGATATLLSVAREGLPQHRGGFVAGDLSHGPSVTTADRHGKARRRFQASSWSSRVGSSPGAWR